MLPRPALRVGGGAIHYRGQGYCTARVRPPSLPSQADPADLPPILQVAGYAVHYRGLVYCTVRGAGHMVPENKPAEALEMFTRFLARMTL